MDNKHNSLHLARKYAPLFVRGHYLFQEANSFPRAKLEENCELCLFITYSAKLGSFSQAIGHFRISFGLFFKASPGAHTFIWKLVFIHMQRKHANEGNSEMALLLTSSACSIILWTHAYIEIKTIFSWLAISRVHPKRDLRTQSMNQFLYTWDPFLESPENFSGRKSHS